MKIRDIMRPGPVTIFESESLGTAQRMMTRSQIRHLPVIFAGRVSGMLSARDILAARARTGRGEDWWALEVRHAMSIPAQTARPDELVPDVARRLAAGKLGAMPIVEADQLVGLVTTSDVLEAEIRAAMPVTRATAADAMSPFPLVTHPRLLLVQAVAIMLDHHVRHLPVLDDAGTLLGMLSDRDVRTAVGDPARFVETRAATAPELHVCDVMTTPAISVPPTVPLVDVARRFGDERIGALPVVDPFGVLLGIVSYVDALRVLTAH